MFELAGVTPKLITVLLQQVEQSGGCQCCPLPTPTQF